jgi:hypothetical protein
MSGTVASYQKLTVVYLRCERTPRPAAPKRAETLAQRLGSTGLRLIALTLWSFVWLNAPALAF